jgi:hypothetical protein
MNVDKSHHIDKSEPDANGLYEYYYDYHLYEFTEGDFTLIARRYTNESEAHFLGLERAGEKAFLSKSILNEPLLHQAIEYLKKEGTNAFSYLDEREGYVEIFP